MDFKEKIKILLEYKHKQFPITSLYLKLDPRERKNFKYRIALKNLIKERKEKLHKSNYTKESLQSVESDFIKIEDYLANTDHLLESKGVAIFSSSEKRVWEVFKLPLVYRNRLVVERSPLLRQLIRINGEFGEIASLIIDRKRARIFKIGLNGAEEVLAYFYPGATRSTKFQSQEGRFKQRVSPTFGGGKVPHGIGEYGFQRTIENEMHQHFKYVADRLFDYYKENKFDYFILGGAEQIVSDFANHLHTYLKEKLVGTINLKIDLIKPDELFQESLDLLETIRHRKEKKLIDEFEDKLGSRLAVNGIRPTLRALLRGQVRILLILDGFTHSGFICPESGLLALDEKDELCPEGKPPVPVTDIVAEIIEETLGQRAELEFILGEEGKRKIDGLGAILRFQL